ncbi:hypothetical protein BDK51DRAFT_32229 [Blyttiomyces helicus]|uniref:Ras-GEF domain-containing protein n=1 Tax=Blyttiomyces helicus TaxID=388810 RepID=A0A4P9WDL3_9FUNG|nr:hypothetical protein BDK51DRAFT_32229 [Blyttiomyces helicus]|eukprot:RKO90644.1 hypothetical protein BDK51DRAFT_32229 [Blyttiomyces helicus]
MDTIESYAKQAARAYAAQNYREGYNSYIQATNAVLVRLAGAVSWENQDVVSKPDNSQELFRSASLYLTRAEEILKARHVVTMAPAPPPSFQPSPMPQYQSHPNPANSLPADAPSSVSTSDPLPLIPLSALTRELMSFSYRHAVAQARYVAAQRRQAEPDLSVLRRLLEDVRIQETKIQELNKLSHSVMSVPLCHWRSEELALQIAIVNADLFSKVCPRQDLVDHANSPAIRACLAFKDYLERIILHGILLAPVEQVPDASLDRAGAQALAVTIAISTADILLSVYRDLNGFCAILEALLSPEFTRLRGAWERVPQKAKEALRHLESLVMTGSGQDHMDLIADLLEQHHTGGGVLTVIPNLDPLRDEIDDINAAYVAGRRGKEVVLSDIGARAQEKVISLVERCQGVGTREGDNAATPLAAGKKPAPTQRPVGSPDDLASLGIGSLSLGHWLLTRVFWSRDDLWLQSAGSEPLAPGEESPYARARRVNELEGAGDAPGIGVGRAPAAAPTPAHGAAPADLPLQSPAFELPSSPTLAPSAPPLPSLTEPSPPAENTYPEPARDLSPEPAADPIPSSPLVIEPHPIPVEEDLRGRDEYKKRRSEEEEEEEEEEEDRSTTPTPSNILNTSRGPSLMDAREASKEAEADLLANHSTSIDEDVSVAEGDAEAVPPAPSTDSIEIPDALKSPVTTSATEALSVTTASDSTPTDLPAPFAPVAVTPTPVTPTPSAPRLSPDSPSGETLTPARTSDAGNPAEEIYDAFPAEPVADGPGAISTSSLESPMFSPASLKSIVSEPIETTSPGASSSSPAFPPNILARGTTLESPVFTPASLKSIDPDPTDPTSLSPASSSSTSPPNVLAVADNLDAPDAVDNAREDEPPASETADDGNVDDDIVDDAYLERVVAEMDGIAEARGGDAGDGGDVTNGAEADAHADYVDDLVRRLSLIRQ